jgi:hypothetical protein
MKTRAISALTTSILTLGCALLAGTSSLQAALIGYWTFDGNYNDSSGQNNHAQAAAGTQAPIFATDVALPFATRIGAQSLDLRNRSTPTTGTNCYALVPSSGALYNMGNNFTVSCWVKGWPVDSWVPFVAKNGEGNGWQIRRSGGGNDIDFTTRGPGFTQANGDFSSANIVANGGTTAPGVRSTQWFHYCCTFDGTTKRIYLNGQLTSEQVNTGASLSASTNSLVFGARDTGVIGGFSRIQLDDVAIWNNPLTVLQIADLTSGADARYLHNAVVPFNLSEPWGTPGKLGLREVRVVAGSQINNLNTSIGALMNGTTSGTSTSIGLLDFKDPNAPGGGSATASTYLTDTAADDDDFVISVNAGIRVTTAGPYSFAFNGDDGFQAALMGVSWTKLNANNGFATLGGEVVSNLVPTGDSATIAVVTLPVGEYNFRYLWFERGGGAFNRVQVAAGDKTGVDATFKVLGDPAGPVTLVDQVPTLFSFTPSATAVLTTGGSNPNPANITLNWDTKFASSIAISPTPPGNPTLTPGIGSVTIPSPTTTTTYTLTGTTGALSRSVTTTVYVDQVPVISSFTANDTTVVAGAPITLNWSVVGASTVSINNGVGTVTPTSGGAITFNAPAVDTTFVLTATNPIGSVTASVVIDIGLPPVIQSFTADDSNIVPDAAASLHWVTTNADSRTITPRAGAVAASGDFLDRISETTTYNLTATNVYSTVSQNLTINLPLPLYIAPAGWSYTRVSATATTITSLELADQVFSGALAGTAYAPITVNQINMGDGGVGVFVGGEIIPNGVNGDNFVVKCTATLNVNFPGTYSFGINNDDGARLRIDGLDVIVDNANHGPTSFTSAVSLTAGSHIIEYMFYEQGGGFAGEAYWIRSNGSAVILAGTNGALNIPTAGLIINEFQASNSETLNDYQGQASDWIELYNGTGSPIDLAGYYLTDDVALPNKWAFPGPASIPSATSRIVQPGEYFVVFASSKNTTFPTQEYHTNFKLSSTGGYLALTKDNGTGGYTVVNAYNPYGAQTQDRSYGVYDTEQFLGYFAQPTPRGPNYGGYAGFLGDTSFSVKRGVKSAPFTLNITTVDPTTTIRYTLDGSTPTETNGLTLAGSLNVSSTTVVRAAAFKTNFYPTNVDTHSYIFPPDVLSQTQAAVLAKGWPESPVSSQILDYGIDPRVVTGNEAAFSAALTQIPSVCITTDLPNLFDANFGIYVNTNFRGENWERPASFEILNDSPTADGTTGIVETQIDCGMRARGGYSRNDANPKHAFRLFFNKQYEGALKYNLFGKEGTTSFKNLDLQCPQNYSWSFDPSTGPGAAYQSNTFMRELFARDTQRDLGAAAYTRTRHYHLYINGIYWGLFASQERAENSFGESYLGGNEDNYDVIKSAGGSGGYVTEATDGSMAQGTSTAPGSAWARLWFGSREVRTTATTEADRTERYFALQGLAPDGVTPLSPTTAPKLLSTDNLSDYLLTVFYTGGFDSPLSTFLGTGASNNWFGLKERVLNNPFVFISHDNEHSMGAEADGAGARSTDRTGPWGGSGTNYKNQPQNNTIGDYTRSNPQFLHEDLAFAKEYRVRFGDRAHRALFNNGALTTTSVNARLTTRANVIDPVIIAESARWGDSKNANPFTKTDWLVAKDRLFNWVAKGSNEDVIAGSGPGRAARVIAQLRAYKDKASGASSGSTDATLVSMPLYPLFDAPVFSQLGGLVLSGGSFTLTNPNTTGDVGTIYYRLDEQDPREIGGAIRAGSPTVTSGGNVFPMQSGLIKARIYQSSTLEWSALAEFAFVVGTPAAGNNLVVSEMNYNPTAGAPGTALDKQDYEFLEFWNPTTSAIQLDGVKFTVGLTFDFTTQSSISVLPPGERLVIVKNLSAFQARYPDTSYPGLSAKIAGVYAGSLDNGGEILTLRNTTTNADIFSFMFDDNGALLWPTSPDGGGPTLCFTNISPTTANASDPLNWFAHPIPRGNPGGPDGNSFATFAGNNSVPATTADSDSDGVDNLLEYALGTMPNDTFSRNLPTSGVSDVAVGANPPEAYQTITFTKLRNATDIRYRVQTSTELSTWQDNAVLLDRTATDLTETVTFRAPTPISANQRVFMWVKVELIP